MENVLRKSGLRLGIGFLSVLMLLDAGSSHAQSSFKNTPLYRHVVKRRNSQPVKLYEAKPIASAEQAKVAETSSDEKIMVASKDKPAMQVSPSQLAEAMRVPVAPRGPVSLADPSTFTREMPFSEAIDILRNCTFPKLNISVLWKDLEENADIYPDTPIGVDGVSGVPLRRHLKSLLDGVSGASPERVGYVVEDGVIVIATLDSLPQRMVTRVYDITDLVGQPSTGFPAMGMMGMGMPGMGMMGMGMPGMGMGMGMGMPGMGMQSGYGMGMPGMGMQSGFGMPFGSGFGMGMPGFGTGYGNVGTGFSTGIGTSLGLGGVRY